ncbi:enoyl-CoA hydratase/isomerase family protein [Brevibacterium luteolum]|uniref:Enoyl-CoA hydratase n=1 Tax=Brevibacterium luteolum TaxID=199591 RepID=A0A2N6PHC9_9MICO|nr:enoyl-CoA hydratase/isomerase family protein [Brevibacterium luteolum]PMB98092.1 enoyl-CoA hydratase [Brevibacterium luteolum]
MENSTVSYRVSDGVGTITLNRPDVMNAIDADTHLALQHALKRADHDPEARVIVLTGEGRAFCAGGDIKGMQGKTAFGDPSRVLSVGRDLIDLLVRTETPLIAKVNGSAIGLGATIALYCDVVCMDEEARIGDRHVNVGLVAGDGGAAIWPLLVGPAKAKEMLMTGRLISGKEAETMGLIAYALPGKELDSKVQEIADELKALPPYAVKATRASVNKLIQEATSSVLDLSLAYEHLSMKTNDHQEAVSAFIEKRPGNYHGY